MRRIHLLRAAKNHPESVFRLAKWLRLHVKGYSARQTARLIWWLFSRRRP